MNGFLLLSMMMLGVGFAAFQTAGPEQEDDADPGEDDSLDPVEEDTLVVEQTGETFLVGYDTTLGGTDGNDTYTLADDAIGGNYVSIAAGAGDDLIDLNLAGVQLSGTLLGEDGNDTIAMQGALDFGQIAGGAGDDLIEAFRLEDATVSGGDGDDRIAIATSGSDPALIEGGAGSDTIDYLGRDFHGTILGGDGDDLLTVNGQQTNGALYGLTADAGAGDDTIRLSERAITSGSDVTVGAMFGGAGADTWELTISEGAAVDDAAFQPDPTWQERDGTWRFDAVEIADFTPGEDVLLIDADPVDPAYALTTARIAQSGGVTELVLRYESDTLDARDVLIDLRGAEITWDDVTFAGTSTPVLLN